MNYVHLHLGDYAKMACHLSLLEEGVFFRLLRRYYATEEPLPADVKEVQRLACTKSARERDAVQRVLTEFFVLADDGWHQSRCDAEIQAYWAKQADGEVQDEERRNNAKERQRRARERRKGLFAQLRELGVTAQWDSSTEELEALLNDAKESGLSRDPSHVTGDVTERDVTANQSPVSSHQSPVTNPQEGDDFPPIEPAKPVPEKNSTPPAPPIPVGIAGAICKLMRKAGLQDANPGNEKFLALIGAGCPEEFFVQAAADSVSKGFAYAVATAQGRWTGFLTNSKSLAAVKTQAQHTPKEQKHAGTRVVQIA